MSEFTEILLVSPLSDGKTWTIQKKFSYYVGELDRGEVVDVPVGFETDFASVPAIFRPLVPKWGKYGKAAIVHDYCYWVQSFSWDQNFTRKRADQIFREAMTVLGVASWRKFLMFWAVRLFAGMAWSGNKRRKRLGKDRVSTPPEKAVATRAW